MIIRDIYNYIISSRRRTAQFLSHVFFPSEIHFYLFGGNDWINNCYSTGDQIYRPYRPNNGNSSLVVGGVCSSGRHN